ncbi:MAG: glycosyltransferase family 2 protein [Hyphomonadaceae bacterium]|nr:glycosyltransferase family 2 protein [Hyphomonadaceae bacterium]
MSENAHYGAGGSPPQVDVCVCTFRRPAVRQALASLAAQQRAPAFRIIVADNDDTPTAEPEVAAARASLGVEILYLHAPARNISIARNACLSAAGAPLVAFIDDDEVAEPGWLRALVDALEAQAADVVFGPVLARYEANAPRWAREGDFHSVRPAIRGNGVIDTGYAGNVIMRRAVVGAHRFDPAFGAGGEDTMFFAALHRAGAKLGYCPEAVAHEPTPAARARMGWLLPRAFRSGRTHARMLRAGGAPPVSVAAPAALKAAYCALAAMVTAWSPVRARAALLRGALHAGVVREAFA